MDLLFVASKIPYIGTVVTGITKAADAIGSIDDFWNEIVDFFGGGDEHKIQIDVDYYLELFVEGSFNIEAPLLTYHTLDGFDIGNFTCESSIKIGIECGGELKAEYGNVTSLEASFTGEASATWELSWDANTNRLKCEYGGLYAVVSTKVVVDEKRNKNNNRVKDNEPNPEEKKYLIHEGFSYEFKLD